MESAIVQSVLEVTNMTYAEEKYGSFVDINTSVLDLSHFKEKGQLPLNEKCAEVIYSKTAHFKDSNFIKGYRPILKMMGFKST